VTGGPPRRAALGGFAGVAALLAASLLLAGLLSEAALRVLAASGNRVGQRIAAFDPFAIKVEPHGAYGYRQRPGAVLAYANGTHASANRQGFRGPEVAVPKPAGTIRIVLLGESSTHGWYVDDDQTIDAYLRAALASARPDLRVEVVNLAYDGYDAYQMWQRLLDDGVRLEPDLIVVNAGANDVRNAHFRGLHGDPDPRTLIWEADLRRLRAQQAAGGPTLWTRIKHWSYLARLPGIVRGLRQRRLGDGTDGRGPFPEAADNFQRNIDRIADVAQHLGVPLLLCTPPSALLMPDAPRPMEPRSYWVGGAAATQRYRDTLAARLRGITARRAAAGQRVAYLSPKLPGRLFLDDVHLTAEGNRAMAATFAAAIAPFLPQKQ